MGGVGWDCLVGWDGWYLEVCLMINWLVGWR